MGVVVAPHRVADEVVLDAEPGLPAGHEAGAEEAALPALLRRCFAEGLPQRDAVGAVVELDHVGPHLEGPVHPQLGEAHFEAGMSGDPAAEDPHPPAPTHAPGRTHHVPRMRAGALELVAAYGRERMS